MSFDLAREVLLIEIQKTERTLATLNHTFGGEREKCKRAIAECQAARKLLADETWLPKG